MLLAAMALGGINLQGPRTALAANFAECDLVIVADGPLNLREEPKLSADVIRVLPDGFTMTVTGSPESADGYTWYQVAFHTDAEDEGWVAGEFLAADSVSVVFERGDGVRVIDGRLNLRESASLSSEVIRVLEEGTPLLIASEPVSKDGYTWFKIRSFEFAPSGWVASEFLVADPGVSGCEGQGPCPTLFEAGDEVRVITDYLNLRTDPTLSADVIDVLPNGTIAVFTGESEFADDLGWLEVESDDFGTGWVARIYVVKHS